MKHNLRLKGADERTSQLLGHRVKPDHANRALAKFAYWHLPGAVELPLANLPVNPPPNTKVVTDLDVVANAVIAGVETQLETALEGAAAGLVVLTDELQALCPAVDGIQPDIYRAEISYTAVTHAIESKSLKLWLVTYRDRRIFAEHLAVEMHDHLAQLGSMVADIRVTLLQNVRGGILTEVSYPA